MPEPQISVVIVTYHSRECVGEALNSLFNSHQQGLIDCIVVDNQSSDGTAEFIETEFPWVKLIRNSSNMGFGRGCNVGYLNSRSPFVIFLNPDAVIGKEAIERLYNFSRQTPKAGIVAPAIIEPEGTLQPAFIFPTPSRILAAAIGLNRVFKQMHYIEPGSVPRKVDWVGGAIFMARREMLDQLNGFDPRFFLYFEETDLCLRAHQAGWEIWTLGEAVTRHVNAVSAKVHNKTMHAGCISEHFYKSRYYYLQKHFGKIQAGLTETVELYLLLSYSVVGHLLNRGFKHEFKERVAGPFFRLPEKPE